MTKTPFALFVYSVVLILGGIMGYTNTSSVISLIAGVTFGVILIGCGLFMLFEKHYVDYVALATTLTSTIVFAIRFSKTHTFQNVVFCLIGAYVTFLCLRHALRKDRFD